MARPNNFEARDRNQLEEIDWTGFPVKVLRAVENLMGLRPQIEEPGTQTVVKPVHRKRGGPTAREIVEAHMSPQELSQTRRSISRGLFY